MQDLSYEIWTATPVYKTEVMTVMTTGGNFRAYLIPKTIRSYCSTRDLDWESGMIDYVCSGGVQKIHRRSELQIP